MVCYLPAAMLQLALYVDKEYFVIIYIFIWLVLSIYMSSKVNISIIT